MWVGEGDINHSGSVSSGEGEAGVHAWGVQ